MKPIDLNNPTPGFYKTKAVKGGPFIAVLIFRPCQIEMHPEFWNPLDRGPATARALLGGREVPTERVWPYCASHPISQAEYLYLLADSEHAARYEPNRPEAMPTRAVNIGALPSPF